MATRPRQETRSGAFNSPLGKDALLLSRFDGTEGLSELFEYRIEALSVEPIPSFDKAIGANCCVSIKHYGGRTRHFNGVLVNTHWLGRQHEYYSYRLVLRPWLWLLSRTSNCRTFADKSALEIVKDVFGKHGFAKFVSRTKENYPKLKYCVQYRESDLNFVCRLMEEAGIYFYFDHSESGHQLVLADSKTSHDEKAGGAELIYRPITGTQRRIMEHLFLWHPERRFNTGKVVLNDYDFWRPGANLLSQNQSGGAYQNAKLEVYDYPGKYKDKSVGDTYAKVRLQAEQATDRRCQAEGDAPSLVPGCMIDLKEHPGSGENRRYLTVNAAHTFVSDTYRSTAQPLAEEIYQGHYEFLPDDVPFRAPPVTPKPIIYGPQTAKVAGKGEIDVDKDGCIMVQFHWDRDKQNSRRVRIAQIWSGKAWGGIVIPRVGQEAVVEFIEGDPDRPLVIGTVYNRDNTPPYPLPGEKTIAGVKSNSTEGGGGFNEFVFDDKKGSELVRMHAQKNMEAVIENDEARKIGHDITVKVGNVMTVEAGMKIELKVGTSTIVMEPKGITIKAPTIMIKADATLDATSPLTTVKGTAILTLKGGLVLIN